jgi:hypothetical protein
MKKVLESALDHLAIAATDLGAGATAVAARLGVALEPGGRHAAMSTHNRLLGLGPGEYLEVIAPDPDAPPPGRARWFGLDRFSGPPAPRAWILRVPDLEAALALAPPGAGRALDFQRGDLCWRMAVPDDGVLPFDGLFPALIQWQAGGHPADRLPDAGVRLAGLELVHPEAPALIAALAPLVADARVAVAAGPVPALRLTLMTPTGPVTLP